MIYKLITRRIEMPMKDGNIFIVVLHTYPIVFEFPFQPVVRIFINITSFISCLIGN